MEPQPRTQSQSSLHHHLFANSADFQQPPSNPNDGGNPSQAYHPDQQRPPQHLIPPSGRFTEEWDASQRGSSLLDGRRGFGSASASGSASGTLTMQRSNSAHSYAAGDDQQLPLRSGTLKKRSSIRRASSLGRSSSRRSTRAGSVKSLALQSASDPDEAHSAFYCPIPTSGSPTEILVNRFQTWRKVLKDLITYYREIQSHYEHRSKALVKLANVANNIATPPSFLKSAGIDDALQFLRTYNKNAIVEANKAKEIESDVILALTGLRSDLQQKIKEIKHLSGDFKSSVSKEMDNTAKAVRSLADVLEKNETDASSTTGKQDPYLLRLAVDRQVERQMDEENYLHQAHLNLEGSGRELESIVVGEIQKAYNAYAGILKREADNAYGVVEELRDGPIAMPKDQEWIHFVTHDDRVVDPTIPLRSSDQIHYPGQDHVAAQEIRAGLLERKSKYLKSYTAGWYVLSTTHLHEFKSADKVQAPVMSLYLPDQKLGSHSNEGGSSNKFVLKGRQTGTMHRGHTWVFRAESHDTMMAWYEDIKALTEKTPEERTQFVRSHSQRRSMSQSSRRSASSDGLDEDDDEPFSAKQEDVNPGPRPELVTRRSQPGGRFPSDIQVNAQRGLQTPQSPSSVSSGPEQHSSDAQVIAAAGALPGADTAAYAAEGTRQDYEHHVGYGSNGQTPMEDISSQAAIANRQAHYDGVNPYTSEPLQHAHTTPHGSGSHHGQGVYVAPITVPQTFEEPVLVPDTRTRQPSHNHQEGKGSYSDGAYQITEPGQMYGAEQAEKGEIEGIHISHVPNGAALPLFSEADTAAHARFVDASLANNKDNKPVRPSEQRTNSTATISNLPIPGGYPKT